MKLIRTKNLFLVLLLLVAGNSGCSRGIAPTTPLAAEQVPAALQEAFAKSKPEDKELVNQITAALQAQDYSKAFFTLQKLSGESGLNKKQQTAANRALLTANILLQSAQAKGDPQAAQTLQSYRANK
jgi:hypothetical protein